MPPGRRKGSGTRTSRPTSGSPKRSGKRRALAGSSHELALAAFADLARAKKLRWYVFGAQAVNLHGYPRATADVDVTVDLGALALDAFVRLLGRAGFTLRVTESAVLLETRVIPVVHAASGLPIDIVLAGPGLEQLFLDEVVTKKLGTRSIPVLSRENLIVTKLIAGRERDLEDVRELIASAPADIDHSKVEGLLRAVEEALSMDTLVVQYRRMRGRR